LPVLASLRAANATLIGDTVTVTYTSGSGPHIYSAVVGPNTQPLSLFANGHLLVDITDGMIDFRDVYTSPHVGIYGGLPVDGLISLSVTGMDFSDGSHVSGATAIGGSLLPQNVSFTDNSVSFQFRDSLCDWTNPASTNPRCMVGGDYAQVAFTTAGGTVSTVPEPATFTLLGLGLAGVGVVRTRKSKPLNLA
jgi:PEP-CTERM motif